MRFIADVMLGRLARWLRILGYDTLYSSSYRDEELARIADAEDRYLLTRDRELLTTFSIRHALLIDSDDVFQQLKELRDELGLTSGESILSRCVSCNGEIEEVEREKVAEEVPPYVYETAECFLRCARCGKIFWPGSHVPKMIDRLKDIFGKTP